MGCFSYACAISGLPIDEDTKVRYLLLSETPFNEERPSTLYGAWFPRTFPLQATYDNHGSVKDVEGGPARDIWLEGLRLDVIERGWGENAVQDVPVKKTMTFEQLLNAVVQSRVRVRGKVDDYSGRKLTRLMREIGRLTGTLKPKKRWDVLIVGCATGTELMGVVDAYTEKGAYRLAKKDHRAAHKAGELLVRLSKKQHPEPPDPIGGFGEPRKTPLGVPTRRRVEAALEARALTLYGGLGNKDGCGLVVDRPAYGEVRVRWNSFGEGSAERELMKAEAALRGDYATMIASGAESEVELLVRPTPGTHGFYKTRNGDVGKKFLRVDHAMIREDVWQAMLQLPVPDLDTIGGSLTIDDYYRAMDEKVAASDERRREHEKLSATGATEADVPLEKAEEALLGAADGLHRAIGGVIDTFEGRTRRPRVPLHIADAVPFTVSLGTHWKLMEDKGPMPREFLRSCAEFMYIQGKDPISTLMEYAQKEHMAAPNFTYDRSGPDHLPVIVCTCQFGHIVKKGTSGNKQDAKKQAARAVLEALPV